MQNQILDRRLCAPIHRRERLNENNREPLRVADSSCLGTITCLADNTIARAKHVLLPAFFLVLVLGAAARDRRAHV